MQIKSVKTYRVHIFMSGPIEVAKQAIRQYCFHQGLCVTIEPTTFIYTGGEEAGFVVGLVNYPRFPTTPEALIKTAKCLVNELLTATFQHSALLVTPEDTEWMTLREAA